MSQAIVLASGGIESTTLIADLISKKIYVTGLFFDIGIPSSNNQYYYSSQLLKGPAGHVERIDVTSLQSLFLRFMPFEMLSVEGDTVCPDVGFTPLFAAISVYYGESAGVTAAYIGLTQEQMRAHTEKFLKNIGATFAAYQQDVPEVSLTAPFASMKKAQVIQLGKKLGVDYAKTWSCLFGRAHHCGVCAACEQRKAGFGAAGIPDPTTYEK
jgi:7-cyano-7-deazaguanine synthase